VERSSVIPPLISANSTINTQRRFTSHALPHPSTMNKENEKIFNINLEQIVRETHRENNKKPERGISQGKRSYRNPSMEETSLKKCIPNSFRSKNHFFLSFNEKRSNKRWISNGEINKQFHFGNS